MHYDTHSTRLALTLAVASMTLTLVGIAATIATPGTLSDVDGSGWNLISFAFPIAACAGADRDAARASPA